MNERIDQLIEQCTVQNFSDCVGGYETFDKEKFAELIVRECANLHDFNSGYYDDNNEWCAYYDKILKHFGVEE